MGDIRKKIEITTGIRQGSTIRFKIVTYMTMAELDKRGKGYNDEHISLILLLLSHSLKDAKDNSDIITQKLISKEYGPEINSQKRCVMIFNVRTQPEHLCNIKVVQKMKYPGI